MPACEENPLPSPSPFLPPPSVCVWGGHLEDQRGKAAGRGALWEQLVSQKGGVIGGYGTGLGGRGSHKAWDCGGGSMGELRVSPSWDEPESHSQGSCLGES